MNILKFLLLIFLILGPSCQKDNFDTGNCAGGNCITVSGYIFDRLTREPLASAEINITYKENCGFCGTGCPFRKFDLGSVSTDNNGYFKKDISSKVFQVITGSYSFDISFENYLDEHVYITNNNQKNLSVESFLSPPAYLNLRINLTGTNNIEYFGLDLIPDSLSGNSVADYNSDVSGLFADTTIVFKVPAERIIYIGYLLKTNSAEKHVNESVTIERFKTKDFQINE
ncbi:MAG: hypothetical protein WA816_07335 [Bacteroidales bacterium]